MRIATRQLEVEYRDNTRQQQAVIHDGDIIQGEISNHDRKSRTGKHEKTQHEILKKNGQREEHVFKCAALFTRKLRNEGARTSRRQEAFEKPWYHTLILADAREGKEKWSQKLKPEEINNTRNNNMFVQVQLNIIPRCFTGKILC